VLPETAADVVKAYDAGTVIEAVPILALGPQEQGKFWDGVMEILRKFPMRKLAEGERFTISLGQFSSWCFNEKIAQPAFVSTIVTNLDQVKAQREAVSRSNAIQGAAFAILREGYRNVIERRAPSMAGRIQIQKGRGA
jgi:hypothetical protein